MTTDKHSRFTVVTNSEVLTKPDINQSEALEHGTNTSPEFGSVGYQTNPLYQKLMQFKTDQKRKRFSVEDLLQW